MNFVDIYAKGAGRLADDEESPAEDEQSIEQVLQQQRDDWLKHPISKSFVEGLLEKSEEYTERARDQSTPFGDQKVCAFFLALSATLRKVITYARTGKYEE